LFFGKFFVWHIVYFTPFVLFVKNNLFSMSDNIIAKDGGLASRKLWFAIFTSIMVVVASKFCQAPALGEVISGLVATAGLYITGNVITKWKATAIEEAKITQQTEEVNPEDDQRG
jgi:hypothetical protein